AGLLARHGWGEPLSGLVAAAAVGAAIAWGTSFIAVRGGDLTRRMVTLGIGLMLYEAANQAARVTGGVDGLSDMAVRDLLGVFPFDLRGRTAYVYSLAVLFAVFLACRRIVRSPFGLSLRGIRDGARRMPALGSPVRHRLLAIYTVAGAILGLAGPILVPPTQCGRARAAPGQGGGVRSVLRTYRLSRRWGALQAVRQVSFSLESGARHALIGPNGAGKTTLVNLLTGTVPPQAGDVFLDDERITHLPQHLRVKRGMTRTFQITTLFPGLTALESVLLAICERKGLGASWWRPVARHAPEIEEARRILRDLHLEAE